MDGEMDGWRTKFTRLLRILSMGLTRHFSPFFSTTFKTCENFRISLPPVECPSALCKNPKNRRLCRKDEHKMCCV
jgi:hypothetical protein